MLVTLILTIMSEIKNVCMSERERKRNEKNNILTNAIFLVKQGEHERRSLPMIDFEKIQKKKTKKKERKKNAKATTK